MVLGCSRSNLFLVQGGSLVTPSLDDGAFPGIMRGAVLEAAAELGLQSRQETCALAALRGVPEVFLTSSLRGLVSVAFLDGTPLPPPSGRHAPPPLIPKLRIRIKEKIAQEAISGNPGGRPV
jgi:branched-chain amino acid aminotransferase